VAHVVNRPDIVIDQALHGYRDGHRLLSSSLQPLGVDARTMLVLSDFSGPSTTTGQNGYLTGYPLEGSRKYVLARTWTAPEMPRPGCVWTHSLLIDFADLAALASAIPLLGLFQRPAHPASHGTHANAIRLHPEAPPPTSALPTPPLASAIVSALYSEPRRKIVAKTSVPIIDEMLLLEIWMQQWPRLRRSFRFCSAAGSDRSLKADAFDLQLVDSTDRLVMSRFPEAIQAVTSPSTLEVSLLVEDLRVKAPTRLRAFLKRVGGDVAGGRGAMLSLCQLHSALEDRSTQQLTQAVRVLEELGPSQARIARGLVAKRAIGDLAHADDTLFDFVVETAASDESALEATLADGGLGRMLWRRSPARFAAALGGNDALARVADAALPMLDIREVVKGLRNAPEYAERFAAQLPPLLREPSFWRLPGTASLVAGLQLHPDDLVEVLAAIIIAGRGDVARHAAEAHGARAMLGAMRVAGPQADVEVLADWAAAVARARTEIAAELSSEVVSNRYALAALAAALDPDDVPNDYGEDPWYIAARSAEGALPDATADQLAGFLMSRGLGRRSKSASSLIRLTFDRIHEALGGGRLDARTASLLSRRFSWGSWAEWDQCARLRYAVVYKFVDDRLDAETFGRLTDNGSLWFALAQLAAESGRGRRYLWDVRDAVKNAYEQGIRARAKAIEKLVS